MRPTKKPDLRPDLRPDWRKTNPGYQPAKAGTVVIDGKRCVVVDGGRMADAGYLVPKS